MQENLGILEGDRSSLTGLKEGRCLVVLDLGPVVLRVGGVRESNSNWLQRDTLREHGWL